ncbi:MAG TPA: DUF4118 domain-containing protein [Candidatus Fimisoma avicola]|uniref:histidine kinase n=1 Tax=Candidatus Fimisoma avicola TaxID=2840826 RepID=A0A9D1L785_9FIRM|nr:DUF4118 domain-containing protein [Candidatus Fimisoma avicola]
MWGKKKNGDLQAAEAAEELEVRKNHKRDFLIFLSVFIVTTAIALALREVVEKNYDTNMAIFYILGIILVARYTDGYVWGALFDVLSILSVNYFFTYPYQGFNLTIEGYPVTFASMLVIYLITSAMTTNMKKQSMILAKQEKQLMEAQKEKMRANLLRAISHDLRTPLTGIIGNSESYLRMEGSMTDEEKRTIVENIENDASWLLNMVENLLSVTRINNTTAKVTKYIEPVDEVVSSAVARFRKRFPGAELRVFLPDRVVMVMMDAMLIEQVLINILQNAYTHAKSVKPVELRVTEDDKRVWFFIKDYGIGIDEKKIETIFDGEDYLKDQDSKADGHKGMGIGLSICKTIVSAHGGDIKARNHNEGSEFYFYLPKEKEE